MNVNVPSASMRHTKFDLALDHVAIARLAALERRLLLTTVGQVDGGPHVSHEFAVGAVTRRRRANRPNGIRRRGAAP